jgi:beta-galactosidase
VRSGSLIIALLLALASTAAAEVTLPFDADWKFHLGEVPSAQSPDFDDSAWRAVELPHDWSIEGTFDPKNASCNAYLPNGVGWYRKTFSLPSGDQNQIVSIRFDGIYDNSTVWINGQLLGQRPSGFASFQYDLTRYAKFGDETNVLAVRVNHATPADARWYTGSGIYRHVHLEVQNPIHLELPELFVTTPNVAPDAATLLVRGSIATDPAGRPGLLVVRVFDSEGEAVAQSQEPMEFAVQTRLMFQQSLTIPQPHLWSPDDPYLYRVQIELQSAGQALDSHSLRIGIRSFHFDANTGFTLNGRSMKLKGVCVHEDAGALGSAIPIDVWTRRLRLLKDGGCNAIRTSHNPPAPEFLDLCDRMGFLVMDEAFDEWTGGKRKWTNGHNAGKFVTDGYWKYFPQWSEIDLAAMIRRDRNHSSIILWSIGNEIDFLNDPFPANSPRLPPVAAELIRTARALDSTRPITAACASIGTNLFCDQLDVVGYNYQEQRYAEDHKNHPSRIIFGSENAQFLPAWLAVEHNDFIAGQFLWTGIDYLGEARPWPYRSNDSGVIDLAGFPKPRYFFRKSLWSDQPTCYLSPTARFVICYTNCDSVELLHDGKSFGEKRLDTSHILVWPVLFDSGKLTAIGKNSAHEVCRFELLHAGPAESLTIIPDTTQLSAKADDDGFGRVAQLEVQCVDDAGIRNTTADPEIHVTVTGPVRLLGIENGDPTSHENYQAPAHKAFHGRMLVYLQSTGVGKAHVSVSVDNFKPAAVDLTVR